MKHYNAGVADKDTVVCSETLMEGRVLYIHTWLGMFCSILFSYTQCTILEIIYSRVDTLVIEQKAFWCLFLLCILK